MSILFFTDAKFEYMAKYLIRSLDIQKVDTDYLYYTIGFDSTIEHPNLIKKRWETNTNIPRFEYYKPTLLLDALKDYNNVIFLDSDIIIGRRFDLSKFDHDFDYPLTSYGNWEFPWAINYQDGKEILVNVATGDRTTRCAATSAAFVNGLKAFATDKSKAMMLPVMKFNYYKIISDKKMKILKILHDKDCCSSLEELSKKAKMSLPLISYHINGNLKSDGLKEMGLVETTENRGRISVTLSPLGKMLVRGYITPEEEAEK